MFGDQNMSEYEYLLPMHDDYFGRMINDPRIKGIEYRSKCVIGLSKRVLSRKMADYGWVKFNIIRISGPNESAINVCNKLLENTYPNYMLRKPYHSDVATSIFIDESTPDNNFVIDSQRSGANLDVYQGLTLRTAYNANTRYPNVARQSITPWQVTSTEIRGMHFPEHWSTDKIHKYLYPNNIRYQKPVKSALLPSDRELINEIANRNFERSKRTKEKNICLDAFDGEGSGETGDDSADDYADNPVDRNSDRGANRTSDKHSYRTVDKNSDRGADRTSDKNNRQASGKIVGKTSGKSTDKPSEVTFCEPDKDDPKSDDDLSLKVSASLKSTEDVKVSVKLKIETKEMLDGQVVGSERRVYTKEIIIPEEDGDYVFNDPGSGGSVMKKKTDNSKISKTETSRLLIKNGSKTGKNFDDSVDISLLMDEVDESKKNDTIDMKSDKIKEQIVPEDETLQYSKKTPKRRRRGKCPSSSRTSKRAMEDSVDVNVSDIHDDN